MLSKIFESVFEIEGIYAIDVKDFIICIAGSLLAGMIISLGYMFKAKYTKSFAITLALLPAMVCVVIMAVNSNIGIGVAVAGAFGLVRFRSAPGTAKEIAVIFLAMATGLIAGTGFLGHSLLFAIIMTIAYTALSGLNFGARKRASVYKTMMITVPEDLNYTDAFKDIIEEYTSSSELVKVKTANMGSLYKLTYDITLKKADSEKDFIDKLRCRNGNLEISIFRQENTGTEL